MKRNAELRVLQMLRVVSDDWVEMEVAIDTGRGIINQTMGKAQRIKTLHDK